jgi:hypothetical protein
MYPMPAFGRLVGVTKADLSHCRWCWRHQVRRKSGLVVCTNCDDPNGKPIPDGDGAPRP